MHNEKHQKKLRHVLTFCRFIFFISNVLKTLLWYQKEPRAETWFCLMQRFESFSNSAEQHNCLLATLQIHGVTVKSILNSYKSWNEYTPPLHSMGIFQLWNIFSHVTAIVQLISEIKTILKIVKIHYEVKQLKSDGLKRSLELQSTLQFSVASEHCAGQCPIHTWQVGRARKRARVFCRNCTRCIVAAKFVCELLKISSHVPPNINVHGF